MISPDIAQDLAVCGPAFSLLIVAVVALWRRMVRLEQRFIDHITDRST